MHKSIWIVFIAIYSFSFSQKIDFKAYTKALCSPEFQGRGYVNGGDSIAAGFIAKSFEEIGLLPINQSNHSYFQDFSFPVNTFPGEMSLQIDSSTLLPGIHFLVDPSSGEYTGNLKLKFVSTSDLYNQKNVLNNWTDDHALIFRNYGFGGDTVTKIRQYLQQLASKIPIIEVVNTKLTWSVSQKKYAYPYIIVQDSVLKETPKSALVKVDAQLVPAHTARNVIGYLPATKKNAKTIVFSAHYDHLGRMGKRIYFPGGNDNASGTAMLAYLASHFKKYASNFNLVFIAFAGEEVGLLGSEYFVSNPLINLKDIRFLINLDIMGSGEEGITAVNGTLFEKEFLLLQKINKKQKALPIIKKRTCS